MNSILGAKTPTVYVLTAAAREDNADIWDEGFRLSFFVIVDRSMTCTWYGTICMNDEGVQYAAGRHPMFEDDLKVYQA